MSDVDVDVESDDGGLLGLVPDCWPPGPVRIAVVLPDSQAAKHQLRAGDELRSINGHTVAEMDHRNLALELAKRPLKLKIHRPTATSVVIDVQVDAAGAMGFFPKKWPPGPVVVGAVLPGKIADDHGVREGDLLWLVEGQQASLMSPAELTNALSQRPVALRFVRGDSGAVARDISKSSKALLVSKAKSEAQEDQTQVAKNPAEAPARLPEHVPCTADGEGGQPDLLALQQRDLQVQQLHLLQLQHRKEQQQLQTNRSEDWLSLLERQNDERRDLESGQRQYLCQLGESLQQHQELLGQLDRQQGTGYSSTVLPPLIPKISKPVAQSQQEASKQEMKIEQIEPPQQEILETPKVEMEPTDAESPPQPETVWSTQTPGEVLSLTAESTLESPAEGLPLSALEPRDMSLLSPAEMPKSRQLQVASHSQVSNGTKVPGALADPAPAPPLRPRGFTAAGPERRLREVPPPARPPAVDCASEASSSSPTRGCDDAELQSWLARSSLSPDAVIF